MLLGQLTGRDDVVFGMPSAGRPPDLVGADKIVGLLLNTLPVRLRIEPGEPFSSMLARLQDDQSALAPHQFLGLATVHRLTGISGRLFDTLYVFENYPVASGGTVAVDELPVTGIRGRDATHYPLTLVVVPGTRMHLRLSHQTDLISPGTADAILERFQVLLRAVTADPDLPTARLPLLSEPESRLLSRANATDRPDSGDTLPGLFEAQAARTPDATAVYFGDDEFSYADLNARANRLAHLLISRGAGPERVVAVGVPRSALSLTAVLATLKTGAAYLPVDPEHPTARKVMMLRDSDPVCVVGTGEIIGELAAEGRPAERLLALDAPDVAELLRRQPTDNPADRHRLGVLRPDHPAYVIYTSGSTGQPKGVVVPHAGIVNRLLWMQAEYRLPPPTACPEDPPQLRRIGVGVASGPSWPVPPGSSLPVHETSTTRPGSSTPVVPHRVTDAHFVAVRARRLPCRPAAAGARACAG